MEECQRFFVQITGRSQYRLCNSLIKRPITMTFQVVFYGQSPKDVRRMLETILAQPCENFYITEDINHDQSISS